MLCLIELVFCIRKIRSAIVLPQNKDLEHFQIMKFRQ